jgi:hypothetical protein
VPARRGIPRVAGYAAVVALLVAATLSAGSVLYQVVELGGHAHGGGLPWLPVAVDTAGSAMAFLLAVQLMVGYGLVRVPRPRFRRVHAGMAWGVVAFMAFHGIGGVVHSLQGVVETLPLVLDGVGVALTVLVALQLSSGYALSRPGAGRNRLLHASAALAVAAVVAGHVAVGIVHAIAG